MRIRRKQYVPPVSSSREQLRKRTSYRKRPGWVSWLMEMPQRMTLRSLIKVGLWLVVVGAGYWFFRHYRVSEIYCSSQLGNCPKHVQEYLEGFEGEFVPVPLFRLPYILEGQFAEIDQAAVTTNGRFELVVELIVYPPAVTVTTERQRELGQYYTVGFRGAVIDEVSAAVDPVLILDNLETLPGYSLPDVKVRAGQVVYYLSSLGYKGIFVQEADVLKATLPNYEVLFPLDGSVSPELLVSTLQLIVTQTKMDDNYVQIDLRFEKPILRTGENKMDGDRNSATSSADLQ